MKLKIFTVYDSKLEAYMQPFFMQSKGAAIRAFGDAVNGDQHEFAKHPGDYTLFEIGEFDDATATFEQPPAKINLGTALEHKKYSQHNNIQLQTPQTLSNNTSTPEQQQ